jgi:hypothetical protein
MYFNQERGSDTADDASLFQRSHGHENYSVEWWKVEGDYSWIVSSPI